ncbi:MAG: VIT1/CCC1 transporter family protein [Bacteroidia bacterium]|nr:VIT1/CCC1 transporter family protein [Bacteroidia bacterium]MCF8425586.1 VIT1/CCC1 transporter family protein [Bacteroidia bacterium]MCF8445711.1 VIT1/CCC1 transporter family protein [Bacteroidia bacterium]
MSNSASHHHHNEEHFSGSEMVRDIVIGMSDGLTVPFALAAGLTGAAQGNGIIITAGLAEIVAGSIAMGLGGYLAGRTEIDHYKSELDREYMEVDMFPEKEKQEVRDVFYEYGLSEASTEAIVEELSQDKDKWVQFMMRYELGLEEPDINRARQSALTIGLSYIIGGIVPLSTYFPIFSTNPFDGFVYSCIVTAFCLFVFGYFKTKIIGQPPFMGAIKTLFIGALAAACAYSIARLIGG